MKILFLGDLHFGEKKSDLNFFDRQMEYLNHVLFNTEYDIIIQVGDVFHNRSSVSLYVLNNAVELFKKVTKPMYITLGNHDQWKKESGEINILKTLHYINPNINVYKKTTELEIQGKKILFVPYLYNTPKVNEMKAVMKKNKYFLITGHFDFAEYGSDKSGSTIVSTKTFKANTKLVVSGHFHIQKDETKDGVRVKHIGTPYHLNRGDRYTNSGAWLYDTETNVWDLLENNKSVKFVDIDLKDLLNNKTFDVEGNIVNLFVKNSTFNKLGSNSIERHNVLTGITESIKKFNPFELHIKPYNDDISSEVNDGEKVTLNNINISDLTNLPKMIDKYYKVRFKETNHTKKVLKETITIIKELL